MSIKLSRNGRLHQLYTFTYNDWADRNFCPFFWRTLIAVLLLPVTWISYPFLTANVISRVFLSALIWAAFVGVAILTSIGLRDAEFAWAFVYVAIGLCVIGVAILVGVLIVVGIVEGVPVAKDAIQERISQSEIVGVIRTKKESVMDRYCPKIDWN